MRIYLPATAAELGAPGGLTARAGHAVTPALRGASPGDSEEDLEVAAFLAAADASLDDLTASDIPLRVVVAADVDSAAPAGTEAITEVRAPAVPWSAVVSIHIDDPDDDGASSLIRAAVGGDDEAVEAAAELDLLWYDVSERGDLAVRVTAG